MLIRKCVLLIVAAGANASCFGASPVAIAAGIAQLEAEQSDVFMRLVYSSRVEQFPEFQKLVFSESPRMLEKLDRQTLEKRTSTDYVSIVVKGDVSSFARIVTEGTGPGEFAVLVQAVVNMGGRSRSWLYRKAPLSSIMLSLGKPALDVKQDKPGLTVRSSELPFGMVVGVLNRTSGDYRANFGRIANVVETAQNGPVRVAIEDSEWKHRISFAESQGLAVPQSVVSEKNNGETRVETEVNYSPLRLAAADRPFPRSIKTRKYVRIGNTYKAYLTITVDVLAATVLPPEEAKRVIDIETPNALSAADLTQLLDIQSNQ